MEALSPTSLFPCLTPSSDVVADSFPREETEETVLGLKIEVIKVWPGIIDSLLAGVLFILLSLCLNTGDPSGVSIFFPSKNDLLNFTRNTSSFLIFVGCFW